MMKEGRAGHSGLTERPILNELNAIVSEGCQPFEPRLRPPRGLFLTLCAIRSSLLSYLLTIFSRAAILSLFVA